ncbi:YbjQ family protein [Candidatus Caldatribacterium sp.]|uniref:YbjQ family protein n=1 Tax=Candidatus Caldatribacterium sp. TaxID=2282143 RepID=UPI002998816F|nr:YbjQ family protein [Candidatus Caldatribacterium sp.]MDW8081267.1 YbjQ family protein [Candidatus Calescibacterium sp.]
MILSTLEAIPGKRVREVLGVVCGSTIRARWIGKDIAAVLRAFVGGEIVEYTEMLQVARKIALERMTAEAEKLGADAVLGVRLSTSMVMSGAAEIIAYGTAVKLEDLNGDSASQ